MDRHYQMMTRAAEELQRRAHVAAMAGDNYDAMILSRAASRALSDRDQMYGADAPWNTWRR